MIRYKVALVLASLTACVTSAFPPHASAVSGWMEEPTCHLVADVCFVVDSSGSLNDNDPDNWKKVKDFMNSLIDQLDIGEYKTRISVVKFSNRGNVQFYLDQYYTADKIKEAISKMSYSGGHTNTSGGLKRMREDIFHPEHGDRVEVPNTAIVITDGVSTLDVKYTIPYAQRAKEEGIRILAVGISDKINMMELEGIASPPDQDTKTVLTVEDYTSLTGILDNLVSYTCFTPSPPQLPDPLECREPVDLVFVLDASGSVRENNFHKMKDFVKAFVSEVDLEWDIARIGLLTFSDEAYLHFHLGQFSNRFAMMAAIDAVPYARGTTNTAAALSFVHSHMFLPENGDRLEVRNVVFLVTDGESNDPQETLKEARLAKAMWTKLYVIGVGNWLNEQELNAVASYPYALHRFHLETYDRLNAYFRHWLRELICNNMNECEAQPCEKGGGCHDSLGYHWCDCPVPTTGINCEDKCLNDVDLVFALDASGSIGRDNFETMVDFVRHLVQGLHIGVNASHVGVFTFANDVEPLFNLDTYPSAYHVLNALPPHYTRGTTNTAAALQYMRAMFSEKAGDRPSHKNIGIVLTDGKSNDQEETWKQAMRAREQGIHLISVGVGDHVRQRELTGIASHPTYANVYTVNNFEELHEIRDRLLYAVCNNVDECDVGADPCGEGGTCEDGISGYSCECNFGYTGSMCERACEGEADVVFALDTSGSIQRERFPIVQEFVKRVIAQLEVSPDKTRVALMTWADDAHVEFFLDQFHSCQDAMQAVSYIRYKGGKTHTAAALTMMRTHVFTSANGDRDHVPNYAYIITDGNSNINQAETVSAAVAARVSGIHIIAVSVGKFINQLELKAMVSDPINFNLFNVEHFDELPSIAHHLPKAICNDQDECLSNPCQNGGRCINGLKKYICRCPEGFVGYHCDKTCRRQLDLVFMLDFSGSVEEQYDRVVSFSKKVVFGLDMAYDRTHVGVVTYGSNANVHFHLNKYSDQQEVINAMSFHPNGGRTNTQEALNLVHTQMFNSRNGDRAAVKNIAVLVTDGHSNIEEHKTVPEARAVREAGIDLYVVAIGDNCDMREVNQIAGGQYTGPENYVFNVKDDNGADFVAEMLTDWLCW